MIIDAHAHIMSEVQGRTHSGPTRSLRYGKIQWGALEFRLLPPLAPLTTFPPEALLENMDWAGVERAVLLQGTFYGEANAYVAQTVKQWPDRFTGAAFIDPYAADARTTFQRCTEDYGFHILKFEMSVPVGLVGLYPDLRLDGEQMAWIFEAAEKNNLVVTLDLGGVGSASYQTEEVAQLIARHPQLRIVIAHLGQPPIAHRTDPQLDALWQEQILLGRHEHVWFDFSSLPAYCAGVDEYPFASACAYIQRAVELIGPQKLLWGTDAPGLLTHATYPQLLHYVSNACDFLSPASLQDLLGNNAQRAYAAP